MRGLLIALVIGVLHLSVSRNIKIKLMKCLISNIKNNKSRCFHIENVLAFIFCEVYIIIIKFRVIEMNLIE